ncbi:MULTISPECIES: efflux RND transporter permease subunit [unclassified Haematobacter]|uniref:efflux RND transporter permease subunit n=1 Tax=unclassified Haematobacter TaxID=2640585 RepID=UPI0025C1251C|nr:MULTISPECIES: efflux RND transporter permease subunit [unclassified Haematobacter]
MADATSEAHSGVALFIRRPVLAFVLNALIVLAGLAALFAVEVRELPSVDRPVLTVTTRFPSASAQTIDREVTAEIEGAAGRVPGVSSISSTSRFGQSRVTVEFNQDVNIDVAASDTRDAISRIRNNLPDDVEEPQIVKADADSDPVMRLAVLSDTRQIDDLTRLVDDAVEDQLISAPGVADLQISGDRDQVFRIDIDQMQLSARGLTLADIRSAVGNASLDAPAGTLRAAAQTLVVRTTAPVTTPEEFEALELKGNVRLGDVARVTLGPDIANSELRVDGQRGIGIGIIRQAQSNTLIISEEITRIVAGLNRTLPPDVRIVITQDSASFIEGAIHEVQIALILTVLIVVGIIYLFLRDWRATMIPAIAMPVALIGTVAAIWIMGFSINILTLLAIVLATGLVVDDAIVVLENIVRRRQEGLGPRAAAVLGTRQVFFAVIATTLTLAAVFVPISFLPGQTGGLFREFGFTLAVSILLSSIVALTLCPVMASRLPQTDMKEAEGGRIWHMFQGAYDRTLKSCLNAPVVVLTVAALFGFLAFLLWGQLRQELTPEEDRATVILSVWAPQGVSLDFTAAKVGEIEDALAPLRAAGEVLHSYGIIGAASSQNRAFMVLTLAPWGERQRSQSEILADLTERMRAIIGVRIFTNQPNSLGIRGAGQGLRFALLGPTYEELAKVAAQLAERMEQDPGFGQVRLGYETTDPQLFIEVDRDRASDLGVPIDGLGEALQAMLDGRTVGTVFIADRSFDIKLVSTADPVDDPSDLERIFVRTSSGDMVPVSTFVTMTERAVAPNLGREDRLRSVEIAANLTPEKSLGAAWEEVRALSAETLPETMRVIPLAEAATLGETWAGLITTFGFALLIVLLVLAAQFESFVSAVIVMATVPLGLACAVFAMLLTGTSLNVYSQIGLVLLVGIMAKNGILIVEFANSLRDKGRDVRSAVEEACSIRLRPVVMTMAATVLGGVPLVLASGAGAEARAALGWIIVGGLGLAMVTTLYLTPVVYLLLAGFSPAKAEEEARLVRELAAAAETAAAKTAG